MRILVYGSGVIGTWFGARLAQAGHDVTLLARAARAAELRRDGAVVLHPLLGARTEARPEVVEDLGPQATADLCLLAVRREQLDEAVRDLAARPGLGRVVVLVMHAGGSAWLRDRLGPDRVVLGFPGVAGGFDGPVLRAMELREQPTVIEAGAQDVLSLFRQAGIRVQPMRDVEGWLSRVAVFITAVAGALGWAQGQPGRLAEDEMLLRDYIRAVREGWAALDRQGLPAAPRHLRLHLSRVPEALSLWYWRRFFASPRAEVCFGLHCRHATSEMVALAQDLAPLLGGMPTRHLDAMHAGIRRAAGLDASLAAG